MSNLSSHQPEKIVLDNGLRIIAEEVPGVLSCSVSLWVNAGSIDEEENNNGISHFIEHIVFKGTKTRSAIEIAEQSENVGANLNAFTDREHTCYHTGILSEYASVPLELILDMLLNPQIEDSDFNLEKQVILGEVKMYEEAPEEHIQDVLYNTFWKNHSLGRPITGTTQSVSGLTKQDLLNHMNKLYTPDNMILSIAGKFDIKEIIKQTENLSKGVQRKKIKANPCNLNINSEIIIEDKNIEQTHLSFATKGVSVHDEDRYTLAILDIVLGGGMSSRLFQEIREKRGLAYTISSYYHTNTLGGLFGVYAVTPPKDSIAILELMLQELSCIKKNGLKKDELERAKMQLRTSLLLELESTKVKAFRNALYDFYYDRFLSPEEINNSIQAITNENILRLSDSIFDPEHFTLIVFGPKKNLPATYKLR